MWTPWEICEICPTKFTLQYSQDWGPEGLALSHSHSRLGNGCSPQGTLLCAGGTRQLSNKWEPRFGRCTLFPPFLPLLGPRTASPLNQLEGQLGATVTPPSTSSPPSPGSPAPTPGYLLDDQPDVPNPFPLNPCLLPASSSKWIAASLIWIPSSRQGLTLDLKLHRRSKPRSWPLYPLSRLPPRSRVSPLGAAPRGDRVAPWCHG